MKIFILLTCIAFAQYNDKPAECTTVDGQVAAVSEKYLDDAIRYSVDKDYTALQSLIDKGAVVVMKGGIKVFTVKVHFTKIEFRLAGSTDVLWTVREGLKC